MDIRQTITETNIFTIFIFILIISGNFLALVPCKLQDELNNNMYVKHLFGLFTMIFFVTLAAPVKDKTISAVTLNSFLLYLLFILITKVHVKIFYVIAVLLGSTYITVLLKEADIGTINANASVKNNDTMEQSNEQGKENPKNVILNNQVKIYYVIAVLLGSTYITVLLKEADIGTINANASATDVKNNDTMEQSKENPKNVILNNQLKIYDNIIFYSYIFILILTFSGVLAYMGEKKLEYKKNFKYVTFFLGKTVCKHSTSNIDMLKALRYSI